MTQKYNISKLLHIASEGDTFLSNITISDSQKKQLIECRRNVRKSFRQGFAKLRDIATAKNEDQDYIANLTPKFFTQGSFAYKTLNKPATTPPQQIDLDDGIYFPMELVAGQPRAAKNTLFMCVDKILKAVADKEGWSFDPNKNTCSRIIVDDNIHIDVPIYAIPQEKYAVLEKNRAQAVDSAGYTIEAFDEQPIVLDENEVYLAVRDHQTSWQKSDPRKLHDWFLIECDQHADNKNGGSQLRRICRYLKAWRDFTWEDGGPSSIVLMVVAANAMTNYLNRTGEGFKSDCHALLAVVNYMPRAFNEDIINPAEETEREVMFPSKRNKIEEIQEIQQKIAELQKNLTSALLYAPSEAHAVSILCQDVFGNRFPRKPEWIKTISSERVTRPNLRSPKQPRPVVPITAKSA